jgi:hypothetical protein
MKLLCGTLAMLLTLWAEAAHADTHCYTFRNDSSGIATLGFSYHPAVGNSIVGVAVEPGKTYPFDGRPWCWNLPEGVTATVAVSGPATPQWEGSLVLGNTAGSAPSGTYVVGAPSAVSAAPAAASAASAAPAAATAASAAPAAASAASAAPAANCVANSFPGNDAYCLTGLESDIKLGCGVGHTGISGTIVVSHLTLQCHSGRKLTLTCGTTTGGRQKCDLNDHEICTDEHVRNAADYCAH